MKHSRLRKKHLSEHEASAGAYAAAYRYTPVPDL